MPLRRSIRALLYLFAYSSNELIAISQGRSSLHECVQVRRRQRALEISERALVLRLARGVDQPGHRGAIERGREADSLHPGGFQLGNAERPALDADHEL